jgi:hypothetical protein
MKPSNLSETINTLSIDRLNSYKSYFNLTSDEQCLGVYLWNDALASSFFKLISIFEVAFRNTLHRELSHLFHSHRTQGSVFDNDWYTYLSNSNIINETTKDIIEKTTHIKQSRRRGSPARKIPKVPAISPGKVISAQSIGFWIKLIETTKSKIDWKVVFFNGFKGHFAMHVSYWDSNAIDDLLIRLHQVAELRNRVAHHEPLWKFTKITHKKSGNLIYPSASNSSESILRMEKLNYRICKLLGWISLDRKNDYINSYYKRHFDWVCREQSIEIFKNLYDIPQLQLSQAKRNLSTLMKKNIAFEVQHKHGAMFISRDI